MKLIKLTSEQVTKLLSRIDDYIDRLYLDTSDLSQKKIDFLGVVRDYINKHQGIEIPRPEDYLNKVFKSDSFKFDEHVKRFEDGKQKIDDDVMIRFERWCYDMYDQTNIVDKSVLDTAWEIIHDWHDGKEFSIAFQNVITTQVERYDSHEFMYSTGVWDYEVWAVFVNEYLGIIYDQFASDQMETLM